MTNKYVLKCHAVFAQRISDLKDHVKKLHGTLPPKEFVQHETVKLAARIRKATFDIIPQDPNRPEYLLTGELKKYRRYRQGLQRYRVLFCFSNNPAIIIYLYLNDRNHLRKQGGRSDPYEEFKKMLSSGTISHDPQDQRIQRWIQQYPPIS
jgi:toxin YhaV